MRLGKPKRNRVLTVDMRTGWIVEKDAQMINPDFGRKRLRRTSKLSRVEISTLKVLQSQRS